MKIGIAYQHRTLRPEEVVQIRRADVSRARRTEAKLAAYFPDEAKLPGRAITAGAIIGISGSTIQFQLPLEPNVRNERNQRFEGCFLDVLLGAEGSIRVAEICRASRGAIGPQAGAVRPGHWIRRAQRLGVEVPIFAAQRHADRPGPSREHVA